MTPRSAALLALVAASAVPCAAAARPWTLADAGSVKAVVSVELSSRGDALFAVASRDGGRNEFATTYFIASIAGAVRRVPFDDPVYAAHWAPDGRTIAVLTPMRSEVPGIAVVDAQSGHTLHTFAERTRDRRLLVGARRPHDRRDRHEPRERRRRRAGVGVAAAR